MGSNASRKWTEDKIAILASNYSSRREFKADHPNAYKAAWRYGWLDTVCSHLDTKMSSKWTEELIHVEALKYPRRSEFQKKNKAAYLAAIRLKIIDKVCSHIELPFENKWDEDAVKREALKYSSRVEFQRMAGSAVNAARRLGIMDDACAHMERPQAYNLKWTPATILEEAKKYDHPTDFKKSCPGAYHAAHHKYGILDKATAHMSNKQIQWTKEMLFAEARKFRTRREFTKAFPGVFNVAKRMRIWDEVCAHMECGLALSATKWTDEAIIAEAKKHNTISDFQISAAGRAARRRNLMDACSAHMDMSHYHYWTTESLVLEASNYSSRTEFNDKSPNARAAAQARGIMDDICQHMERISGDADSIYIWEAKEQYFKGRPVYKLGVTSERLGMRRIKEVAKAQGFDYELIILAKVKGETFYLEQLLLSFGDNPLFIDGDGKTEFRALSEEELMEALDLIDEYRVIG